MDGKIYYINKGIKSQVLPPPKIASNVQLRPPLKFRSFGGDITTT